MKQIYILLIIVGVIGALSVPVFAEDGTDEIPEWIKDVTVLWVDGHVSDEKFVQILEFLIEHEIIQISGYGKIDIQEEETIHMELTVTTNKSTYEVGEKMEISGTLPNNEEDPIVILFLSPDNMIVSIKNINTNGSGEYLTSIELVEALMHEDGNYIIRIKYQGEQVEKTISFTN